MDAIGAHRKEQFVMRLPRTGKPRTERGTALILAVVFAFLIISGTAMFMDRNHYELRDSNQKAASVRSLFSVHGSLSRAHRVINEFAKGASGEAKNPKLTDPEQGDNDETFIAGTNRMVRLRTDEPSNVFDADGNEVGGAGDDLPQDWYVLEARVSEPLYTRADGVEMGVLKLVRQYVRDGTPLSNNFVAVVDDDLGLGGSPVNPGKPAEGEIHTNKHLYIMTSNPYFANRLLSVTGVSYTAGATEAGTVYLHPDNNFSADPLYLPLPSSLTSNPDDPDDTLKNYASGSSPSTINLASGTVSGMTVSYSGIASVSDLKKNAADPTPTLKINYQSGQVAGVVVDGYVDSSVTFVHNPNGNPKNTMTLKLVKNGTPSKYLTVTNVPVPETGVVFFDTKESLGGGAAYTSIQGKVSERVTVATTGNVDIIGSVQYVDDAGDLATKLVYKSQLDGVDEADYGTLSNISDSTQIAANAEVSYFANKRPPGMEAESGDGFYDGDAVLGVVAANDVIIRSSVPQNAEVAGAYISLQKRLTLEGLGYNAAGQLSSVSGSNPFYTNNGGRSSIRRFGSLVSYKRPCTTVVTGSGAFYYGFKRGFSLFDEDMKQAPPPFFPKDKRPQYLGWELRDLGVKPIAN